MKTPIVTIKPTNGEVNAPPQQPELSSGSNAFNVEKFKKWPAIFQANNGPLYYVRDPLAGKTGQTLKPVRKSIETHT